MRPHLCLSNHRSDDFLPKVYMNIAIFADADGTFIVVLSIVDRED